MFEKELDYFKANQTELVKRYIGKVLVIKDTEVVGVYDDNISAYTDACQKYELGTFMIQPCEPGPEAYTVIISTSELISA